MGWLSLKRLNLNDNRWHTKALLLFIVTAHCVLIIHAAISTSATYDEPAHMAAGVSYFQFEQFGLYSVNPPLPRLIAAIPVLLSDHAQNWKGYRLAGFRRAEFQVGRDFVKANGNRFPGLLSWGRIFMLPFSLLALFSIYRWSYELWGPASAVVSTTAWSLNPFIIGHASLVTCDVAGAASGVFAAYRCWVWSRRPQLSNTVFFGFAAGVAMLCKSICVLLWPLWLVTCFAAIRRSHIRPWPALLAFAFAMFIGFLVLNLGYLFEGTGTPLGTIPMRSEMMGDRQDPETANRFSGTLLHEIPIPVPGPFLRGIDQQKYDLETITGGFLLGTFDSQGRWYYVFIALGLKLPLIVLLLTLVSIFALRKNRQGHSLVLICAVILGLVSISLRMDDHGRYAIPALPFLFIWLGGLTSQATMPKPFAQWVVAVVVVVSAVESFLHTPHHLAYQNQFVGQSDPYDVFGGSDIDWGQRLYELKTWADSTDINRPFYLAYTGSAQPLAYGIKAEFPSHLLDSTTDELPHGWYVFSANLYCNGLNRRVISPQGMVRLQRPLPPQLQPENNEVIRLPGFYIFRIDRSATAVQ